MQKAIQKIPAKGASDSLAPGDIEIETVTLTLTPQELALNQTLLGSVQLQGSFEVLEKMLPVMAALRTKVGLALAQAGPAPAAGAKLK